MVDILGIQALIDALDDVTLVVERERVVAANKPAVETLGRAAQSGDVRLAIRHPLALEHILKRHRADVEVTGIGGAERPWLVSVRPLSERLTLVRLTDRGAAQAAEKMRVDFVANASHELRTPLSTILGYAETIAEDPDLSPEMNVKFGGIIRSEAKRMLRIVEDLLSLSRIEANRFVSPSTLVSVEQLVHTAVEGTQAYAEQRQCRIDAEVERGLPLITGDAPQLSQLLDNLLGNALRYGCRGAQPTVTVSAAREGRLVRISVKDEGEGIPREHLPRLTERFYRVDNARSRDSGGTGLGLAIVKHIVERHNGTLEIRSQVGVGTEVIVRLPAEPVTKR